MVHSHKARVYDLGFTLIEVLVVIAIMLILSMVTITGLGSFSYRSGPSSAARTVLGTIEEAHARTLGSHNDTVHGVHVESNSVTLFQGATYNASDVQNEVRPLPARTTISTISLAGGGADIIFTRLSGTTAQTGTLTIQSTADATVFRTITIYKTGFSEIQ